MKTALLLSLLACMLTLATGCKKEPSTVGDSAPAQRGVTQTSGPSADTAPSTLEQLALKDAQAFLGGGGNVNAKDSLGTTRLMDADLNDYGDVVILLASQDADVNATDDTLGQTALHLCAIGDNARAAAALIQKGANINAKDRRGKTPLHEAASAGATDFLKLLLGSKADIKNQDGMGKTPLHRAAQASQAQAIAILLDAGADPTVTDQRGRTPADYAKASGNAQTVAAFNK